jgi:hypothetical protein
MPITKKTTNRIIREVLRFGDILAFVGVLLLAGRFVVMPLIGCSEWTLHGAVAPLLLFVAGAGLFIAGFRRAGVGWSDGFGALKLLVVQAVACALFVLVLVEALAWLHYRIKCTF